MMKRGTITQVIFCPVSFHPKVNLLGEEKLGNEAGVVVKAELHQVACAQDHPSLPPPHGTDPDPRGRLAGPQQTEFWMVNVDEVEAERPIADVTVSHLLEHTRGPRINVCGRRRCSLQAEEYDEDAADEREHCHRRIVNDSVLATYRGLKL